MADEKRTEHPEDTTSDPAEDAPAAGSDWAGEGGATAKGPATDTDD